MILTDIINIRKLKTINKHLEKLQEDLDNTHIPSSIILDKRNVFKWHKEEQENLIRFVLEKTFTEDQDGIRYEKNELLYLKALGNYLINLENVKSRRDELQKEIFKYNLKKESIMKDFNVGGV